MEYKFSIKTNNEGVFSVGDIVTIDVSGAHLTGRIAEISSTGLTLDCSYEYRADIKKFDLNEISYIRSAAR